MPDGRLSLQESSGIIDDRVFHDLQTFKSFARTPTVFLHVHRVALALYFEDVIAAVPDMEGMAAFPPLHIVCGEARHLVLDLCPRTAMFR